MQECFQLKPFQKSAIRALQSKRHVICVAPTGSGKSLIYEQIARSHDSRTLLITPLRALARQQVSRLSSLGVCVIENGSVDRLAREGARPTAWVVSPERLFSGRRTDVQSHIEVLFSKWRPRFLVVDEAHCLWDWGESFRKEFSDIRHLIQLDSIQTSLWLTATLTTQDRLELLEWLPKHRVSEIGAFQFNEGLKLRLHRIPFSDRLARLNEFVLERAQSRFRGIIFVQTREMAERLAIRLKLFGLNYAAYHAGLAQEVKLVIETQVISGQIEGLIATSAFGMGVDCPWVDWVLLFQASPSLTALAQAIGRAARGHRRGEAQMWWEPEDFRLIQWQAGTARRARELTEVYRFCHASETFSGDVRELFVQMFRSE